MTDRERKHDLSFKNEKETIILVSIINVLIYQFYTRMHLGLFQYTGKLAGNKSNIFLSKI